MTNDNLQPLMQLRERELVHHGLAKQREALLAYAQTRDYEGIYTLYSLALGSAVLIPSWSGEAYRYYLMTRLSEVQWLRRDEDEAIILWDLPNEVVVVMRVREGWLETRITADTITCEEATPIGAVA